MTNITRLISSRVFRLNYNIEESREYRFNQDILDIINPYYDYKSVAQLSIDDTYDDKRISFVNCMPVSRYI
jgi:hypothetical protein